MSGLTILTSTGVDRKTDISGNIRFINLNDNTTEWVNQIQKYDRYDGTKNALDNGYDLKEMVDKVLNVYTKIEKRG